MPDTETLARWNEFLENADMATHYVSPHFFEDYFAGQGERFAVHALECDRIEAVVTGVVANGRVSCGMAVRPQSAFRVDTDRDAAANLLMAGLDDLAEGTADVIEWFSWHPITMAATDYIAEQSSGNDRVVMLDLSEGSEAIFKRFAERRRSQLRKSMRDGKVTVKPLETEEELAELYEIHKDWNRRKRRNHEEFSNFRKAALETAHRQILIANFEGKMIAGTFFRFVSGGVVEFAANHSYQEFQRLHPNELIMWKAIEWACSENFRLFSMGGSHPFLTRFGGDMIAPVRFRRDKTLFRRHDMRESVTRLAMRTYKSLPASVQDRIKSVRSSI